MRGNPPKQQQQELNQEARQRARSHQAGAAQPAPSRQGGSAVRAWCAREAGVRTGSHALLVVSRPPARSPPPLRAHALPPPRGRGRRPE